MKLEIKQLREVSNPWFKTWFDSSFYHKLYGHRNEKEAEDFVITLMNELEPAPPAKMLDLGCGNGRHAKCLASRGFNVTGIDLAFSSIQQAKKYETETLQFFQHDMRDPFGSMYFDYIFNFFTSFGYFSSDNENNAVIKNMAAALKPNGFLLIDYLNYVYAEKRLVAEEQKEIDGIDYKIRRWSDRAHIHKRIEIDHLPGGKPAVYTEKVMKLDIDDFSTKFEKNGMKIKSIYGDYDLNSYDRDNSPRLILLAQKVL
jgi:SAM-dependent methyltransferase